MSREPTNERHNDKVLTAGSRDRVNSLNSVSVGPSSRSECVVFSSRFSIARVAQAFLITWDRGEREGGREGGEGIEGVEGQRRGDRGREGGGEGGRRGDRGREGGGEGGEGIGQA